MYQQGHASPFDGWFCRFRFVRSIKIWFRRQFWPKKELELTCLHLVTNCVDCPNGLRNLVVLVMPFKNQDSRFDFLLQEERKQVPSICTLNMGFASVFKP